VYSRRQKAIEFAKNVPKPRAASSATTNAATSSTQLRQHQTAGGDGSDYDDSEYAVRFGDAARTGGGMHMGEEYAKESRIMELEAQHNSRKMQIEAMKKSMGLK